MKLFIIFVFQDVVRMDSHHKCTDIESCQDEGKLASNNVPPATLM